MFIIIRVIVGAIFLVSGFEKLLSPYQNFLYVIQAYQVLPSALEVLTALLFPWVELFVGLFTVLGLWTQWSLRAAIVLCAVFITVVGQALGRGLLIDKCGCFGANIQFTLPQVLVFDSFLFLLILFALRYPAQVSQLSLDRQFQKPPI